VAIGPVLADTLFGSCPCNPKEFLWIYIAGPFVGGSVAAIAYPIIKPNKSIE
jgi:glycerol uptake facilitator-like aquaporin